MAGTDPLSGDDPGRALARAAEARGLSLAALSAAIRRNPSYLHQFVHRGSPRALAERDRAVLAAMLGLPEAALGAPAGDDAGFEVPRLTVEVSAGPGAVAGREEVAGRAVLDRGLARSLGLSKGRAAVLRVRGTSMQPSLNDGDEVVVDLSDRTPGRAPRIYVVRVDEAVLVKRVSRGPAGLRITSDNPAAPPVPAGEVAVLGRAVWRAGPPA